jgi:protein-S-isoprenylcysteine O-methyltransferase Ste14
MNPITIITAWRDERSLATAIKHHDRAGLATAASLLVTLAATLLKGSKYAALADFLDPDTVAAVGVLAAGAAAGFGHWAGKGTIAATADSGPAGNAAAPAGEPAAAETRVQASAPHSDDPASDMPLGG